MYLKMSLIGTILITFIVVFLLNDNLDVVIKEFKIDDEKKELIVSNLNNVEERYMKGPFYTEEIKQEGIEIVSSKEEIVNDKKYIKIILKSLETKILYEKVHLTVSLFNKDKEVIETISEEIENVEPQQLEELLFDIDKYKASYFKVHYRTENGKIID